MFDGANVGPRILMWLMFVALLPVAGGAQSLPAPPDPASVRVHIGPLLINPTLSLTNAGVDTNVFNEADSEKPQSDFTITATPASDLWLRVGRTWVGAVIKEDLVWYRKLASERSVNSSYILGWTVPLTRMTVTMGANWLNTRERPGFEIDARSKRNDRGYSGGVELRALAKTFIGARGERRTVSFDKAAVFLGSNLHDELSRTQTTEALTLRRELTPLTSFTVDVSKEQDRFEFSPLRDSDSSQVSLGLKFDPDGIISGSAQVGYRHFTPLVSDVPGYNGSTAAVNVSYEARGRAKVTTQVTRDVQYSFDINQPYYLLTGVSGSVAQQIIGPVAGEGRIGRQRLSYRERTGTAVAVSGRVDYVRTYGVGVSYHLGRELRLAFNVDHQTRTSDVDRRSYSGFRYGTAVIYGS